MTPNKHLIDALGDHLDAFSWKLWVSVTVKPYLDEKGQVCRPDNEQAMRTWGRFNKLLRHEIGHRSEFLGLIERHKEGVTPSFCVHGLFCGEDLKRVSTEVFREKCLKHLGETAIETYDPHRGAKHYLVKYLSGDGEAELIFSRNLPRWLRSIEDSSQRAHAEAILALRP
ncbi:hypothetical protein CEE36_07665 [candidate division TA06 bacterium B3_TA06]|uniref:Uncharacterized protein n=1 Tax=candidate division TA06 bacterium B3_TA06 TaxID=2012487 RepID=A0A532V3X9_UNCT6|nr:MAG: hypothetical protein CEE36_07665 [candidate division TA06 bacterium B3_TA06]